MYMYTCTEHIHVPVFLISSYGAPLAKTDSYSVQYSTCTCTCSVQYMSDFLISMDHIGSTMVSVCAIGNTS